jgi:hypothetical protein
MVIENKKNKIISANRPIASSSAYRMKGYIFYDSSIHTSLRLKKFHLNTGDYSYKNPAINRVLRLTGDTPFPAVVVPPPKDIGNFLSASPTTQMYKFLSK